MLDFFYSISKQGTKVVVFFVFCFVCFVCFFFGGGGRRRRAQRQSFKGHKNKLV